VIQVAAESSKAVWLVRAGTDGSDLKRFIPIGVKNDDAHNQCAVLPRCTFNSYGVPHLLGTPTPDTLANPNPY